MTAPETDLDQVEIAAREIIPELAARLARHGLGELEIRRGTLRVRVVGTPVPASHGGAVPAAAPSRVQGSEEARPAAGPPTPTTQGVTSPAVGFFVYADGLGPGLAVEKGDALGWVEMLGVRHDVRAPRGGVVRNLVTESGEPVEYSQLLIELEPAGRGWPFSSRPRVRNPSAWAARWPKPRRLPAPCSTRPMRSSAGGSRRSAGRGRRSG